MLRTQRINSIRKYVIENQTASIDELISEFKVSKNTIRRDIQFLVESGELKKVYGGVVVNPAKPDLSDDQLKHQVLQENSISKSAAYFVEDGDTIFIDSGLIILDMLEYLKSKKITVVTNSLDFITYSLPFENLTVLSIGGLLNRNSKTFTVLEKHDIFKSYNINKAFLAPGAISITSGASHSNPLEHYLLKAVVEKSTEVYLLAEHFKFDKNALLSFCDLDIVDCIITDMKPHEKYIEYTREKQIRLVVTDDIQD
nr:DeoR/GlpR family DNA-binding transcription regulator [Lysinibacillus timonensis]